MYLNFSTYLCTNTWANFHEYLDVCVRVYVFACVCVSVCVCVFLMYIYICKCTFEKEMN